MTRCGWNSCCKRPSPVRPRIKPGAHAPGRRRGRPTPPRCPALRGWHGTTPALVRHGIRRLALHDLATLKYLNLRASGAVRFVCLMALFTRGSVQAGNPGVKRLWTASREWALRQPARSRGRTRQDSSAAAIRHVTEQSAVLNRARSCWSYILIVVTGSGSSGAESHINRA